MYFTVLLGSWDNASGKSLLLKEQNLDKRNPIMQSLRIPNTQILLNGTIIIGSW